MIVRQGPTHVDSLAKPHHRCGHGRRLVNVDHFIHLSPAKLLEKVSNIEQRSRQPKAHTAEITALP